MKERTLAREQTKATPRKEIHEKAYDQVLVCEQFDPITSESDMARPARTAKGIQIFSKS